MQKKSIDKLHGLEGSQSFSCKIFSLSIVIKLPGKLAGTYDAVIVCLGAKMVMLPELAGKLPLRTCRGVVAHFQLHDDIRYLFFMPSM